MANRTDSTEPADVNNGKLFATREINLFRTYDLLIDDRMRRLGSSFLNLLPVKTSSQRDRQTFRTAFVHSAAILFVLGCGACALLAYRVLEPFLRSILWSVLAGAFLFPFKNHLTYTARRYLRQLDTDSHLLLFGLFVLLPLRTIDRTIESVGPLCLRNWKALALILVFLPTIELLQSGVVYRWLLTIGCDISNTLVFIVHIFDSPWMTTLVIGYLIAVLTIYESSPIVRSLLNLVAVPVWFVLLIYLSQFLPATYRFVVIILSIVLTIVGFIVDLREHFDRNSARKFNSHAAKKSASSSIAEPNAADAEPRRRSVFTDAVDVFNFIRAYYRTKRAQAQASTTATSSAFSTPYFTFVLWSLVAIKVYQFYWYLFSFALFVIIYKIIKYLLIKTYLYLTQQEGVQNIAKRVIDFLQAR